MHDQARIVVTSAAILAMAAVVVGAHGCTEEMPPASEFANLGSGSTQQECQTDEQCIQLKKIEDKPCMHAECKKGTCHITPLVASSPCDCMGTAGGVCDGQGACCLKGDCNACLKTSKPGGCTGDKQCDDGDLCTLNSCVLAKCVTETSAKDGNDCDDNQVCTSKDRCTSGVCKGEPDTGGTCDDGNPCTAGDACKLGKCEGKGVTPCDDNNPCTVDACDETKGCIVLQIGKPGSPGEVGARLHDGNGCTPANAIGGCQDARCWKGLCVEMSQSLWLASTEVGKPNPKESGVGDKTGAWYETQLSAPGAVVWGKLKGKDTLFIADTNNNVIKTYDPKTRKVSKFAGSLGGKLARQNLQLKAPGGLAWTEQLSDTIGMQGSNDSYLAVSDTGNGCIRLINTDNDKLIVHSIPPTCGQGSAGLMEDFMQPVGLAFYTTNGTLAKDPKKYFVLYVVDKGANKVKVVDLASMSVKDHFSFVAGTLNAPWDVAVSRDGYLYVTDSGNHRIVRIFLSQKPNYWQPVFPESAQDTSGGGYQDGSYMNMRFNTPKGLAIDDNGVIYVADAGNHVVRRLAPMLQSIPGGKGGGKGGGSGSMPNYKEVSSQPASYQASTIAGFAKQKGSIGGFGSEARMDSPVAVALGPKGKAYKRLYVSGKDGRIRFVASPERSCDDNNICTYDQCESGKCMSHPFYTASQCDDHDACTNSGMCEHTGPTGNASSAQCKGYMSSSDPSNTSWALCN